MWVGGKAGKKKSTFCFVRESEVDVPVFFRPRWFVGPPWSWSKRKNPFFFHTHTHESRSMSHQFLNSPLFLSSFPFTKAGIIKKPFFVFLSQLIFSNPFPFDFPFIFGCGWLVEIGVWILHPHPRGRFGARATHWGNLFFFRHLKEKNRRRKNLYASPKIDYWKEINFEMGGRGEICMTPRKRSQTRRGIGLGGGKNPGRNFSGVRSRKSDIEERRFFWEGARGRSGTLHERLEKFQLVGVEKSFEGTFSASPEIEYWRKIFGFPRGSRSEWRKGAEKGNKGGQMLRIFFFSIKNSHYARTLTIRDESRDRLEKTLQMAGALQASLFPPPNPPNNFFFP